MGLTTDSQKEINASRARAWYAALPPERKRMIVERNERRRQANMYLIYAYLSVHPCIDCGETDVRVLEFDHVRGVKRGQVGSMAAVSRRAVIDEIAKCDVVCANCHKRRTWIQLGYRDYRPVSGGDVWAA